MRNFARRCARRGKREEVLTFRPKTWTDCFAVGGAPILGEGLVCKENVSLLLTRRRLSSGERESEERARGKIQNDTMLIGRREDGLMAAATKRFVE